MSALKGLFQGFYRGYNSKHIQSMYERLSKQESIRTLEFIYGRPTFEVEMDFKGEVLALRIDSKSIISAEMLIIIGYFFENYSSKKNCVWTKDQKRIKKFFRKGLNDIRRLGGAIKINIKDEEVRTLMKMLTEFDFHIDEEIFGVLCENISLLETMDWTEFKEEMKKKHEAAKESERIDTLLCMDLPLDWENVFSGDERAEGVRADSIADGFVICLNTLGRVDIEYISSITGEEPKNVIGALKGSIFQNPLSWNECFYKGWETADEYLSGNIGEKIKVCREANKKYKGYFEENITALEGVLPKGVDFKEVYVTLGSPWVPTEVIDDFIEYLLGPIGMDTNDPEFDVYYATRHEEISASWYIPQKQRYHGNVASETTFGTKKMNALHIIERTLNMKKVTVTKEVMENGKKKRVVDERKTMLAMEKQQLIIEKFQSWVKDNAKIKKTLSDIYKDKFASTVVRRYDGSFLTFPGMSENESLYAYQKNAVARILFSPNTLLAHDVGSGKTYVMIASGMELRRLGISKKNMYVVPNNLTGQWKNTFYTLYPDAKILCIEPKSFGVNKRKKVIEDIHYGDYDGIIIAYSCFEKLKLSTKWRLDIIDEEIKELSKKNKDVYEQKQIKLYIKRLENERKKSLSDIDFEYEYFEDLGINTLFVDEAHNFKNVPLATKIHNVLGINPEGSARCREMMEKVHCVQKQNGGRGVVFATGTPITNSISDVFVMQRYLQSGQLAMLEIDSFDSWVGMFAEKKTEFEIDVDTGNFRMATRFSKFHNIPELSNMLASFADFHRADENNDIPLFNGYDDMVVRKSSEFGEYLNEISERAEKIRKRRVSLKEDNMLKITTDGRKAALDLRLVGGNDQGEYSKVFACGQKVFEIYEKTTPQKLTQLIFCDSSVPGKGFNVYDEMARILTLYGIPREEIAYIHDADSEYKREILFEKVRSGEIRVLIGSTFRLGLGVNVQDRLVALHHLDVPWRPSDMVQREGRILRQGNMNENIEIYRYITEGSFDAYSWQLLETKQRFITELLKGSIEERSGDEVDDTVLNYAEVKALAIGNPLIKKRVELMNSLQRLLLLNSQAEFTRKSFENELLRMPGVLANNVRLINNLREDIKFFRGYKREYTDKERAELRRDIFSTVMANELSHDEITITNYQGFDIIVPVNMTKSSPYVWVQKNGRYYVDMGDSKSGVLVRIDNFFDRMEDLLKDYEERLERSYKREEDIKFELEKKNEYPFMIDEVRRELTGVDRQLGVDKEK